MKLKIFVSLLIFLFALPLIAAPPQQGKISNSGNSLTVDNTTLIDVNRILMFVTNHGNFGRDLGGTFGYDYGTWYPYSGNLDDYYNHTIWGNLSPNYASGLWVGGTDSITGDTLVTIAEYSDEYVPGPMSSGTFMTDNVNFRNFKLYKDSLAGNPNLDYLDYMEYAVPDQGAPVDSLGEPAILGDQFIWSVYNDADASQHSNMSTAPLGIEVKQAVFGWKSDGALGDIVFIRYRIYNKGLRTIENANFSIWCDPDLGQATDDFVGCDTLTGLGFVWNDNPTDQSYTNQAVPSMGFDFLQGPLVAKTSPDQPDGKMWGKTYTDSTNLGMESFNKYTNGTDPVDEVEAYNYMSGLTSSGAAYVYNGQELKYVLSGDPVTKEGDIDVASADRRWMQSTGPLTFRPGDSTEIYVAMVLGQSADNISSIIKMRSNDIVAQQVYDSLWQTIAPPATPILATSVAENSVTIGWTDTSEVDQGTYPFEGYNVYQGATKTGPWKQIASFDLINNLEDLYDWKLNDLTGALEFVRIINADNKGIKRFITVYDDAFTGQELRNITEYHFKVEAYSYSEDGIDQFKIPTSSATTSLTPQAKVQDVEYDYEGGDLIDVTHTAGVSGGVIRPQVIFPDSLTGDTYQVVFADTIGIRVDTTIDDPINYPDDTTFTSIDIAWHLINLTTGDTLLAWQTDQVDTDIQESLPVIDGFMLTVTGPDFGVVAIDEVADASGAITPVDNVMWSLNSSGDWYIGSDKGNDFSRMNWRGKIGISDWEIRFTAAGSEYYDWISETLYTSRAPFEVWNIGISTPDDPSDDVQINFAIIDDDSTGGWSWSDRIYPYERAYSEPSPANMEYTWDDDFHIGRIQINDASGTLIKPEDGTVIRFTTAKTNTSNDVFTFTAPVPDLNPSKSQAMLDKITTVPNPFYLYNDYSKSPGVYVVKFHHLPTLCTISIYNLAGELVKTIKKDDASTAIADWDVLTDNGLPVASGIYVYVVDAPGYGQKVGKMAIFVEQEVLKIY